MRDPCTVAWDFPKYPRSTLITIWHVDPETDGTDDSCGWFMRSRHGKPEVLEKIIKAFGFDWDTTHEHSGATWYAGWFNPDTGLPILSVQATALEMFRRAAFIHFGDDWDKTERFMRRNLYSILSFAENTVDSMRDGLIQRFGRVERDDRIASHASMIYGFILRVERPWYREPRWHVHHWRIQIRPWQKLRRFLLTRCCKCGKGFRWGESPISSHWDSPPIRFLRGEVGLYHGDCHDRKHSGLAVQATSHD